MGSAAEPERNASGATLRALATLNEAIEGTADWLSGVTSRLDRTLYQVQQHGLTLWTVPGVRLWQLILNPSAPRPSVKAASILQRRYQALLNQDLANVAAGHYPRALLYQFPLFDYLARLPEALADMPAVVWRRYRGRHDDLPADADAGNYPSYYRRTFHWQTDGWLSDRSARLYDAGVEFLFGGTADVMRRMAIPSVVESLRTTRRPRVLDVGCGTGRFLRAINQSLPEAKLYGLDLSPYYLAEAGRVLHQVRGVSLVTDNAQGMPFAEGFFDTVTSVYLFHELPRLVRRDVLREMRRVVAPGGRVVVCDSAQLSDSGDLEDVLRGFPSSYHEPYYGSYLKDDLSDLMTECGLEVESSEPWLVSKVVVGRRPA